MIINIISGIVIFGAAAVLILRAFAKSGYAVGGNTILKDTEIQSGFTPSGKDVLAVFGVSFLFRVLVFVVSAFAVFIMRDGEYSLDTLLRSYMQWDANNYHRIAMGGYSFHIENGAYTTLAFFPLYPWLVRIVNLVIGDFTVSGILTSSLLYSAGCAYMYKLMSFDYSKDTATRAIAYLSVFPHSFFFGTMMNESALFFTSVATLYYIRRHAWEKAGVFGAFASMSRLAGILLVVPAVIEWFENYRIVKLIRKRAYLRVWKLVYKKALWIVLMCVGTLVYLYCNYRTTGEWFKFMEYQESIWHNTTVYFGECLSVISGQLSRSDFTVFAIWLPELCAVVFVCVMLIYGLRKTRTMYTVYLLVYIIINMSMSWPLSIGRYMTCAVPAFMILSDYASRHKWTEQLISTVMAIAFGVFFTAYFMGRQVM